MALKPNWARHKKFHDRSRRDFDREDLLDAWLQARRLTDVHEDLRDYYVPRYRALSAALGIDLTSQPKDPDARWIHRLFIKSAERSERLSSPFADYIEEGPEGGLYARHGAAIQDALDAAFEAYWALLLDCMREIWRIDERIAVSREDLLRHGFDPAAPAPDPVDYW